VNNDIERSLELFPSMEWRSRKDTFDLREESDRLELKHAVGTLKTKQLISNDSRNLYSLYLSSYLKGFDRAKKFLENEKLEQVFEDSDFSSHRDFSGNDVLAFYLKDISLEINSGKIGKGIEIADCQGSDSPNPLHLAMIQDYLLVANLLIYVISSRTGIRQADINFLSMIKRMGIIDQVIFVVNCDFSEHESYDELAGLIIKIKEDLETIKQDPEVHTFSALLSLFQSRRESLKSKDQQRLEQWETDKPLLHFSESERSRFYDKFYQIVTKQRYTLLLRSHFERLKTIESRLKHSVQVNREFLNRGSDEVASLLKRIKTQLKKTNRVKSLVKRTFEGALHEIKREVKNDVDRFFDVHSYGIVSTLLEYIKTHTVNLHQYEDRLGTSSFTDILYLVYQEFKYNIDTYMAENINPQIFNFVRQEEAKIKDYFDAISGPYETMVNDTIIEYHNVMEGMGFNVDLDETIQNVSLDLNSIKNFKNLELPPASATMSYSAAIKTEAIVRFGVYNIIKKIKIIFKRPINEKEYALRALQDAILRMKKETEQSLIFHFKSYKENIKFQYLFKLLDASAHQLNTSMMDRFHLYSEDLSQLTNLTTAKHNDKAQISDSLAEVALKISEVNAWIDRFEKKIGESTNMSTV